LIALELIETLEVICRQRRSTMTNEMILEEGVILNELEIEEVEEAIAPGVVLCD
jgi:hypothetical protein